MSEGKKLARTLSGLSVLSAVSALTTYVFIALVARKLGKEDFGTFTFAWSLTYTISGSLLAAVEPEATRLMVHRHWPQVRKVLIRAVGTICVITPSYFLLEHVFSERRSQSIFLLPIISLLVLLMLVQVTARAFFASQMKRIAYGLVAPADSLFRLAAIGIILLIGMRLTPLSSLAAMTIGTGFVAVIATLSATKIVRSVLSDGSRREPELILGSFDFSFLLAGTIAMTCLISGIPLLIRLLSNLSNEDIGLVGAAMMIARVPLLLVMGFESILVQEFHRRISTLGNSKFLTNLLVLISLLLGLTGGIFGFLTGPWLVEKIAGTEFNISPQSMAAFSLAIGLTIGASLLTPLCIALNLHKYIARAWVISLLVFVPLIAIFGRSVFHVAVSLAFSSAICVVLLAFSAFQQESFQLKGINND